MTIHLGRVSTYPCFILYIVSSKWGVFDGSDAVRWVAGRASSLLKTEWLGAHVVICLERGADLHMAHAYDWFYLSRTGSPG